MKNEKKINLENFTLSLSQEYNNNQSRKQRKAYCNCNFERRISQNYILSSDTYIYV